MQLRTYQSEGVDRIRDAIRKGARSVLIVAPTGSGKTVVASHILRSATDKGNSSLFIAHRRELIKQASNKLTAFEVEHGILLSGEPTSMTAETYVASIQTFTARVVNRKTFPMPAAELLVVDEAHHATANSYLHLKHLYSDSIILGLTATPCRKDGRGLGKFFDAIVEISTPQELIDMGFLVNTRVVAPRLPDLTNLRTVKGDYEEAELEKRMEPMIGDLVRDWHTYAAGRPTVVFAVTIAHSVWIQQKFEDAGVACEHIDGDTPHKRRDRVLQDLSDGKIQVVTNCNVLTEGWDQPQVSCAILAKPTKSYGLYLQMAGRICRTHPGKTDALIIDHSGAVYRHGFPQDAGGWELDPSFKIDERKDERLAKEAQPITCRECFTVYTGQPHCPNCGALPSRKAKSLDMDEGRLYEVKRQRLNKTNATMQDKRNWYGQLKTIARQHNRKHGWAAHTYREKFGVWPATTQVIDVPLMTPTTEVENYVKSRQIAFAKRRGNG